MRISPLPPLQSLVAFDAAARHGSFTKAAEELHVTQGAVSRQISQLEKFLGRKLFVREHRTLRLTVVGQRYGEQINCLLSDCAGYTAELMKKQSDLVLTIACASGTANLWLAPRIANFRAMNPDISIRILVRESVVRLTADEFDVGIYYLRDDLPPGLSLQKIIDEKVFAFCSPAYLDRARLGPAELIDKMLLVADEQQRQWMSWHDWFALCGVKVSKLKNTLISNQYPILVQMAVAGQGILLGWDKMIDPLVDGGQLVKASDASASHGGGYYLVCPGHHESPAVSIFSRWVEAQMLLKLTGIV